MKTGKPFSFRIEVKTTEKPIIKDAGPMVVEALSVWKVPDAVGQDAIKIADLQVPSVFSFKGGMYEFDLPTDNLPAGHYELGVLVGGSVSRLIFATKN